MNQNTPGKLPLVVLERWREGLISLRKGTELIDEEEYGQIADIQAYYRCSGTAKGSDSRKDN